MRKKGVGFTGATWSMKAASCSLEGKAEGGLAFNHRSAPSTACPYHSFPPIHRRATFSMTLDMRRPVVAAYCSRRSRT